MIVTVLSGAIRTKALGAKTSSAASAWRPSSRSPTSSAAPPSAVDWRNRRRVTMLTLQGRGRLVDGGADAHVRGAAADVARHPGVDIDVGRPWHLRKQGDRRHDLTGLAVPALSNVELAPGALDRLRDLARD